MKRSKKVTTKEEERLMTVTGQKVDQVTADVKCGKKKKTPRQLQKVPKCLVEEGR